MATFFWKNARMFVNELDLSGQFNQLQLDYNAEVLDATVMNVAATRIHAGGLWTTEINHSGFLDYTDDGQDQTMFDDVGGSGFDHTIIPTPGGAAGVIADGDHAIFGGFVTGTYTPGGTVGELAKFSWTASGKNQLAKGRVSIDDATAVSGVADGSAYQLGAGAFGPLGGAVDVPAGDRVLAMVHITADDFTDLDVVLESDDVENFGGTPTTLATEANSTGITSFLMQSDGSTPITDDWFRLRVSGFTGTTATVLGSIAVVRGR